MSYECLLFWCDLEIKIGDEETQIEGDTCAIRRVT
jgi:hypothetical protein